MQNVHQQGIIDIPKKEYEEEFEDTLTKYGMLRKVFIKISCSFLTLDGNVFCTITILRVCVHHSMVKTIYL